MLYGLGGIGKTQMAIEFARKHQEKYSAVFWLNGNSRDTLLLSFSTLFQQLPGNKGKSKGVGDPEEIARAALQWFSTNGNKDWLLIYDNIDRDWSLGTSDSEAYDLYSYFPSCDQGSIIVTTRLQCLAEIGHALNVGRVSFEQGIRILAENSKRPDTTEGM